MRHHIRRHIFDHNRAPADKSVRANVTKLVNAAHTAQDRPIADMHMACGLRTTGEDHVITNDTVMGNVAAVHIQAATADLGDAFVLDSAAMHSTVFAKYVVIANDQLCRFVAVFFILTSFTDTAKLEKMIA